MAAMQSATPATPSETSSPKSAKPAKTSAPKKPTTAKKGPKPEKMSALDAAAKVLSHSKTPLTCGQLIESMAAKGYWTSPGGKTPAATLYSAMSREIAVKGAQARFRKTDRGLFAAAKG